MDLPPSAICVACGHRHDEHPLPPYEDRPDLICVGCFELPSEST